MSSYMSCVRHGQRKTRSPKGMGFLSNQITNGFCEYPHVRKPTWAIFWGVRGPMTSWTPLAVEEANSAWYIRLVFT